MEETRKRAARVSGRTRMMALTAAFAALACAATMVVKVPSPTG